MKNVIIFATIVSFLFSCSEEVKEAETVSSHQVEASAPKNLMQKNDAVDKIMAEVFESLWFEFPDAYLVSTNSLIRDRAGYHFFPTYGWENSYGESEFSTAHYIFGVVEADTVIVDTFYHQGDGSDGRISSTKKWKLKKGQFIARRIFESSAEIIFSLSDKEEVKKELSKILSLHPNAGCASCPIMGRYLGVYPYNRDRG